MDFHEVSWEGNSKLVIKFYWDLRRTRVVTDIQQLVIACSHNMAISTMYIFNTSFPHDIKSNNSTVPPFFLSTILHPWCEPWLPGCHIWQYRSPPRSYLQRMSDLCVGVYADRFTCLAVDFHAFQKRLLPVCCRWDNLMDSIPHLATHLPAWSPS